MDDSRRRSRISTLKEASVFWKDDKCRGEITNISLKGCLVDVRQRVSIPKNDEVRVVVHLEEGNPEFDIHLRAKFIRQNDKGMALDFTQVSPDSFQHLFRFVQLNSDNPEDIEEELGHEAFNLADVTDR